MTQLLSALKTAFGDCKRLHSSACLQKTSYEVFTSPEFYVYDEEGNEPVRVVDAAGNYQLIVKNSSQAEVCLIKTDKCLFNDADDHKRCDCIIFNTHRFFFVEIKDTKVGQRSSRRITAIKQLEVTVELLRNNGIDLNAYETKAIICFKSGKTYPTQASANAQRAVFFEKYKISLEEGNEISF